MCIYIPSNEELSDDNSDLVDAVVDSMATALVVLPIEPSVSSLKDGAEGATDNGTVHATEEEGDGWIIAEEEEEGDGCWVGGGGGIVDSSVATCTEGGDGWCRGGDMVDSSVATKGEGNGWC